MPRWLTVALTLIVYTAIMAALALLLREYGRPAYDALWDRIGGGGVWAILIAILIPAGIYGYWPRRPDGSMRRLRSPWD